MSEKTSEAHTPDMIPISSIWIEEDVPNRSPGWEKRVESLAASIKEEGQIVPISVIRLPEGQTGPDGQIYRLIAGRRRIEAHKLLKRTTIKAVSMPANTSKKSEFIAHVAENFSRENLSPLEEALQIDYAIKELDISQQDFAKKVGMTSGWVSQRLALLKEEPAVQKALEKGDISFTHVRDLSRVKDPEKKEKLLEHAKTEGASEFKERVDRALGVEPKSRKKKDDEKPSEPTHGDVRDKKEAMEVLGKLDKAFVAARKAEEKEKAAHLSGVVKGISWAYRLKGAKIPI